MNPDSAGASVSRKERDRILRRQDLMNAAEQLFAGRGFHNTSMEEIAKQAGYGTGTIYLYFKSKEELYQALLLDKMQAYYQLLKGEIDATQTAWEKLCAIIRSKFNFFRENQAFLRIYVTHFITPDSSLGAGLTQEAREIQSWFHDLIGQVLQEGMRTGEFRRTEPALAQAAFTGLTDSVLLQCFNAGDNLDVAATEAFVIGLFAAGLLVQA